MSIEIVSIRFKEQWHAHKCPRCKKLKREPNTVCGKMSGDHVFACVDCLQDIHLRLGSDVLIDTYLDQIQYKRFQGLAPDKRAEELDMRDAEIRQKQLQQNPKIDLSPPQHLSVQVRKQKAHDKLEELNEGATVLTEDEIVEELEKIKEQEKI